MDQSEDQNHEPNTELNQNDNRWQALRTGTNPWLVLAVLILIVVSGIAVVYGYHQQSMVRELSTQSATTNFAMNQLQGQVNALTARLNEVPTAAQTPPATPATAASIAEPPTETSPNPTQTPATPSVTSTKPAPTKHTAAKQRKPVDKRYSKLQAQLADQQQQLKDTQAQVEKYRSDLEGNINSTRDELNGSIAKTHEELVALEKRGERNYVEFDLSKSKQFQRVGPLSLSLRKADTKHKNYNLAMIVDDNELNKKQVNLYEPVWIHTENDSQPVLVVVNRIEKNLVHGYISTPKYKASELASSNAASAAPGPANAPALGGAHNSQQPQQQPQQ
jgi:uncharacterized coiled-coil protein SlyX